MSSQKVRAPVVPRKTAPHKIPPHPSRGIDPVPRILLRWLSRIRARTSRIGYPPLSRNEHSTSSTKSVADKIVPALNSNLSERRFMHAVGIERFCDGGRAVGVIQRGG